MDRWEDSLGFRGLKSHRSASCQRSKMGGSQFPVREPNNSLAILWRCLARTDLVGNFFSLSPKRMMGVKKAFQGCKNMEKTASLVGQNVPRKEICFQRLKLVPRLEDCLWEASNSCVHSGERNVEVIL